MKRNKLNRDKIIKKYLKLKSLRKTAKVFKCSFSLIRELIKDYVILRNKPERKILTEKDIDEDIKTRLFK